MTGESCKISVIVPVYNKEAYLRECVDSILSQDYQNMEVILVDDASTDDSGRICDDYGQRDARVKVIHKENGGPTAACVTGMEAAAGDYYMFVDSDDYVEPAMLTGMAAHLTGKPGEIICCNHLLEKQKTTEPVYSTANPGVYQGEELQSQILARLIGQEQKVISLSRCMKLCEKSVFTDNEKYYDYSIRFGDDSNMMYPAFLNSTRVVVMEQAFYYHYRYVGDSIVHGYDAGMYRSVEAWRRAMERIVADKGVKDGEEKLRREYCYMLMLVMKNELRNPGRDYGTRIRQIFRDGAVRACIMNTPLSVQERSNQLMYLGMRYPDRLVLWLLRMVLRLHDRG